MRPREGANAAMLKRTAPAKVNLSLRILGRRADGYHLLESLTTFAELGDEISVAPADRLTLTVDGEFAAAAGGGKGNLVLKAAQLLQERTGCAQGATICLTKHVPVGAGLGGGSADAAMALHLLNELWTLNVSRDTLIGWAPELGADVAMCLAARPVFACGIGEILTPLPSPLPAFHAVLVHPRTPLLTADVYRALQVVAQPSRLPAPGALNPAQWLAYMRAQGNDLEPAAMQVSPDVPKVLHALQQLTPAASLVRMTGSGACCFALYPTPDAATQAAAHIRAQHPHWWVVATPLFSGC